VWRKAALDPIETPARAMSARAGILPISRSDAGLRFKLHVQQRGVPTRSRASLPLDRRISAIEIGEIVGSEIGAHEAGGVVNGGPQAMHARS
jgi:hypothetical protein